jgi:signal transduction histidine kinase
MSPLSWGSCLAVTDLVRSCFAVMSRCWAQPFFRLLVALCCFLFVADAKADRAANWRMFQAGDGLRESYSAAVTVSPRGNVWVKHGEASEISVLDGYGIHTLPSPGQDHFRVYESRTGQLWSLFEGGLVVYDGANWVRHPIQEVRAELQFESRRQLPQIRLLPLERDHVLVLLSGKLMSYDAVARQVAVIIDASHTGLGRFIEMTEPRDRVASESSLWISGTKGIGRISGPARRLRAGGTWREYLLAEPWQIESSQMLFEDENGSLITAAVDPKSGTRSVARFDREGWTLYPMEGTNLRQVWPGWDGTLWGFSVNSLVRLDLGSQPRITRERIWAGQYKDVATETNGVFWLATSEGVLRYAPKCWRTPVELEEATTHFHAILEQHSRLWFASSDSLVQYYGGAWKAVRWPDGIEGNFDSGDVLMPLPDGRVLATAGSATLIFDPATERFQHLSHPSGSVMKWLGPLPDDSLCLQVSHYPISTSRGFSLERYDGINFQPLIDSMPGWNFGGEIEAMLVHTNGDLWLGGSAGLARVRDGVFELFGSAHGFRESKVLQLAEVGDGRIWCASADKILEYNGKEWSIVRAGVDRIDQIIRDNVGRIWVASSQGLMSFANDFWMVHGLEEGLPSSIISDIWMDKEGRLWAATTRGLSRFHPEADLDPPRTLPPVIETAGDRMSGERTTILLNAVDKWRQTPADRLLFSTRLNEGPWTPFTNSMVKTFTELGAGKHRFHVRAMDSNWNQDRNFATLEFAVVLPWSRDPRLIVILVSGLILVLFFAALAVNRHLQLIRSYAEVEKIVALRTRELERANQELLHSQKMKALGTLAAGIAHDFNNILSIIKGSAQIIEGNIQDQDKIRTRISRIKSVVEQGSGIVRSILGLSRVSDKDLVWCHLNLVVEETIKLMSDRLPDGIQLHFAPAKRLPLALAVRDLIQQMLLNLILNAADAMEQEGVVRLRTGELGELPPDLALSPALADRYLFVSVQDGGCGIAPDIMPRIFEPFFTTKALSARRGTGLGLSMAYELAKEMGYGLDVKSTLGQGSTFTVILPVKE